jgi:hypothetical protein
LRSAATEASRRLRGVNADVVGVVLNGVPVSEAREYYVEYVYQEIQVPRRSRPTPNPESASTGEGPQDTHEAARR